MRTRLLHWALSILLCATGAVAASPPRAAPPEVMAKLEPAQIWASGDGSTIYLVGAIMPGTFTDFIKVARANPKARTLFLASVGGTVVDGYLISDAVRSRRLDTWVEWFCASSCTLIYASGQQRILGKEARLGFHQTFVENAETGQTVGTDYRKDDDLSAAISSGDRFDPHQHGDDKTVRALRRANVSDAFIGRVLRTPPQELWFPDLAELQREGMVTRVIGEPGRLPLPKPKIDRTELEAQITSTPFWQALRAHEPVLFAAALGAIFRETNSGVARTVSERGAKLPMFAVLDRRVVSASDAVVSRFIATNARQAAAQRRREYPACQAVPTGLDDGEAERRYAELEAAYIGLLEDGGLAPVLSPGEADKFIRKNQKRLFGTGIDFSETGSGKAFDCRMGYRMDEALDRLEPKYRIPLFRAWLAAKPPSAGT